MICRVVSIQLSLVLNTVPETEGPFLGCFQNRGAYPGAYISQECLKWGERTRGIFHEQGTGQLNNKQTVLSHKRLGPCLLFGHYLLILYCHSWILSTACASRIVFFFNTPLHRHPSFFSWTYLWFGLLQVLMVSTACCFLRQLAAVWK